MTPRIPDLTETVVFDLRVNAEAPVIVKFQSESCVICKKIEPFLLAVAKQFSGQVGLGDVDVEKNEKLASRYQIPVVCPLEEGVEDLLPTIKNFMDKERKNDSK